MTTRRSATGREGRDAVSLLERVRSDGSVADGSRKQRQRHSSSGGGASMGGKEQVTRCHIASICAGGNRSTHKMAALAQPPPRLCL